MKQYRYSIISVDFKNYTIDLESNNYIRIKKECVTPVFGKFNITDKDDYIELCILKITHIKTKSKISGLVYFIIDHELIYKRESFFTCPGFVVRWVGNILDDNKKTNLIETVQAINYGLIISDKLYLLNAMLYNPTKNWFDYYKDNIYKLFEVDGNL